MMKEITLEEQEMFRKFYLGYAVTKALATTSLEDREATIASIEAQVLAMTFSELVEDSIASQLIDSVDDI